MAKRIRLQNAAVVVASYIFYGWWDKKTESDKCDKRSHQSWNFRILQVFQFLYREPCNAFGSYRCYFG